MKPPTLRTLTTRITVFVRALARFAAIAALLVLVNQGASAQDMPDRERLKKERTEPQPQNVDRSAGVIETPVNDSIYVVGPNDVLNLSIFADRYYSYDLTVSSNGRIVIPVIGEVYVKDRTLAIVRAMLKSLVDQNFRRSDMTLSLVRARQIRVSVTGAVTQPGVVLLPATARVTDAMAAAGGIVHDTTAMRGLRIERNGRMLSADPMAYTRLGDASANPFLMSGDVVFIPRIDARVSVFGAVNYEGHLDFVDGDRLFDCIRLAGGFRSSVQLDSVQIIRFKKDQTTTESFFLDLRGYPADTSVNIRMLPSDLVLVRAIPKFHRHRLVLVKGEVLYPGTYPIEPGKTRLSDIIRRAGGFTAEASLEEATVTRKANDNERDKEFERLSKVAASDMQEDEYEYFKARSRERVGQMVVDFKKFFLAHDTTDDIVLQEDDFIDVPFQKNYIRVYGRVKNPGNIIYKKEWKYADYIDACSGFGWRAKRGDVRVVKARGGEIFDADADGDYVLEPGDAIWVPEQAKTKFWEVALTTVGVLSQIAGIFGIIWALTR
jgi:polysaccharide biosynthesis/export protein